MRAAYDALCRKGIAFIGEPRGPDADTRIETVVCCRDPGGHVVELIEYMPGVRDRQVEGSLAAARSEK